MPITARRRNEGSERGGRRVATATAGAAGAAAAYVPELILSAGGDLCGIGHYAEENLRLAPLPKV